MKIRIKPKDYIELDVPDYIYKAYDEQHMIMMLDDYIRNVMMSPEWYAVNPNDLEDIRISYRRRKKGVDRIESVTERERLFVTPDHPPKGYLE